MRWTLAAVLLAFSTLAAANDVGEIKVAKGDAYLERGKERLAVKVGMPVQQSDKVVTGADGTVGITFSDNSLLSIGPGSTLAIDRYVFDSTTHAGQFDSTLSKGTLAVISGKIAHANPDAVQFSTNAMTLGVRGTEFIIDAGDQP